MRNESPASLRIQKARTALVLDHPFFGSLLFRLKDRPSTAIKTMATDGVSLLWNPEFVETLNAATLAGTLAHEVMHPALRHHLRRSGRDPKRWNIACDYAINPLLVDAGLKLPEGVLLENRFRGMSAEQIYNLLEPEEGSDPDSDNDERVAASDDTNGSPAQNESGDPSAPEMDGGIGQVLDAPTPSDGSPSVEEQAREWEIAVKQAMTVAQQAGKMPTGLDRTMEGVAAAAVNWRELLRRLWSETTVADYSWMRPNRRYLWRGLYLPGVVKEGVGEIVIAVDCSGSISGRQLRLFEAEARSILDGQRPERVYVLYFDAVVQKVEVYEAGQPISLNPVGGGGTEFGPCFEWVEECGTVPQTMVFLTDLYGSFPTSAPSYPVLWASTGRRQAPFGDVIPMQAA
ncbi:VWA-like domain-containing protein [Acidicapsa dinghuensis]|uniref:VWA-like domain-containing protein n=1 Tax=Acidicapsa dinghuensis TaxID=2218256 RepID=A0ABW1ECM9_9BACT|nr:VWA-like domain-containing protein [Acidicapsa dinghuensis]